MKIIGESFEINIHSTSCLCNVCIIAEKNKKICSFKELKNNKEIIFELDIIQIDMLPIPNSKIYFRNLEIDSFAEINEIEKKITVYFLGLE